MLANYRGEVYKVLFLANFMKKSKKVRTLLTDGHKKFWVAHEEVEILEGQTHEDRPCNCPCHAYQECQTCQETDCHG